MHNKVVYRLARGLRARRRAWCCASIFAGWARAQADYGATGRRNRGRARGARLAARTLPRFALRAGRLLVRRACGERAGCDRRRAGDFCWPPDSSTRLGRTRTWKRAPFPKSSCRARTMSSRRATISSAYTSGLRSPSVWCRRSGRPFFRRRVWSSWKRPPPKRPPRETAQSQWRWPPNGPPEPLRLTPNSAESASGGRPVR